jgi:hypothetical protein
LAYGAIIISVMALIAAAIAARYIPTEVTKRRDRASARQNVNLSGRCERVETSGVG